MASVVDRFRSTIGFVVAAGFILPMFDPAISWFVVPAAIGGMCMAAALFYVHRSGHLAHLEDATDAPDSLKLGMFNLSSVNPSGIGGLGLMFMAIFVALRYSQGQFLLGIGLTGGLIVAATLIRYRRTHRELGHSLIR
jgi:hypothetical protein